MERWWRRAQILCAVLVVGCGSSSPPKPDPLPPGSRTPTDLHIVPQDRFWEVHLAWTRASGTVYGYVGEYSIPGQLDWTAANSVPFVNTKTSMEVGFDIFNLPELVTVAFRIAGVLPGLPTEYSNTVEQYFPLAPISPDYVYLETDGVRVNWTNFSRTAEHVVIERRTTKPPAADHGWITVATLDPGPPLSGDPNVPRGTWVDTDAPEASLVAYRLHAVRGNFVSEFSEYVDPVATAIRRPTDLVAIGESDGIHLSWTNHSRLATELVLFRSSAENVFNPMEIEVAHLPADATSYVDHPPDQGAYGYFLVARGTEILEDMEYAQVYGYLPAAHDPPFRASVITSLQLAGESVIDLSGRWISCGGPGVVVPPDGPPSAPTYVPGRWASPCASVTVDGTIHGVFIDEGVSPPVLKHAAYDGASWSTEMIASDPAEATQLVDPQGGLQVAWMDRSGSAWFAKRGPTGWAAEPVPGIQAHPASVRMTLDTSGAVHLLVRDETRVLHASRATGGGWSVETLVSQPELSAGGFLESGILRRGGTDLEVFFATYDGRSGPVNLLTLDRVAGVWNGPTLLGRVQASAIQSISSPDWSRTAVLIARIDRMLLREWRKDHWEDTLLGPSDRAAYQAGFDETNRLHLLAGISGVGFGAIDEVP